MEKNVNGQVTRYFYDGDSINPLYETDGSGTVLRQYVYSTSGARLAMKSKGQTLYYHYNPRGDVVAMTNQDKEVVATYEYDSWGNVVKSETKGIAADNPFGYAGYMYDKEIGMYYLIARYYNPDHGVFLSIDPEPGDEDDPVTQNGYTYVDNNPVMLIDPDGNIPVAPLLVMGARVAAPHVIRYAGRITAKHLAKRHTVYVLKNSAGKVKYVGRTVNPATRKLAHKAAHPDLKFTRVRRNLDYFQARGMEQRFYLKYGGKKALRNKIRPVSKTNKNYKFYMQQSRAKYKK
ncbi:RHS repeat-associated core domain-containing protein [Bacillus thuringiensis]|nr:RHS repeat-associated core domain-containing protein [Bacillus thuringiensis]